MRDRKVVRETRNRRNSKKGEIIKSFQKEPVLVNEKGSIRLNKYIANAGICSRRKADELIEKGEIQVDGKVIRELGYQVGNKSKVFYQNREIQPQTNKVYIILNKPKNTITTNDDPEDRKIALDYIDKEINERVYPVGRLDRNTTGVLLLTNDGDLAQRLTHPSREIKKVYFAELNKEMKVEDLVKLTEGIELEDGEIHVDHAAFPDHMDKSKVGVEIHSGRNRIVRRMFEHLGYDVKKLDRVLFAGLDKRKLKRGEWRMLTEKEVRQLKLLVSLR